MVNTEIALASTWSNSCVLTDMATKNADTTADPPIQATNAPTGATFKITDSKLYVPVVSLSAENNSKLLEELKAGLKQNN